MDIYTRTTHAEVESEFAATQPTQLLLLIKMDKISVSDENTWKLFARINEE